jgi:hypothetical protein
MTEILEEGFEANACDCGNIFKVEPLVDQFITLVFLCDPCLMDIEREVLMQYTSNDI